LDSDVLDPDRFPNPLRYAEIDGVNVTGSIAVPSTGCWGTFLRIVAEQQYFNLDAIRISQQP
jgi:hypothetical protein